MSLTEILEELPTLSGEEKQILFDRLTREIFWSEEEDQIIEEGIRSRAYGPSVSWEEVREKLRVKYGF